MKGLKKLLASIANFKGGGPLINSANAKDFTDSIFGCTTPNFLYYLYYLFIIFLALKKFLDTVILANYNYLFSASYYLT